MAKQKQIELCTPKLINGVLSFETSIFMLNNTIATVVSVQNMPHLITVRHSGILTTYTSSELWKKLNN